MSKSAFIEQTRGPRAPVSNIDRHGHKGTSVLKRHCNVPLPEWGRERAKEKQSVVNNVIKIIGHANVILRAMQESNNEHHVSSNELNHMPLEWSFFFIYFCVACAYLFEWLLYNYKLFCVCVCRNMNGPFSLLVFSSTNFEMLSANVRLFFRYDFGNY